MTKTFVLIHGAWHGEDSWLAGDRPTVVDVVTSFEPSFRDVTSPLTQG